MSFTSNFESCCNLRFRNDKNELRQKRKFIKWIKKKKRKLPTFLSFRFCSIPKIENSEISESVPLLLFFCDLILTHIFPENFIKVPQVVQKIWRFSCTILIYSSIFWVFWHVLVNKEVFVTKEVLQPCCYKEINDVSIQQMISAFFYFQPTLNRLFNNCIKLCWYSVSCSWIS